MRFEKEVLTSCGWRWSKLTGRAELPACSTESLLDEMWCAVVLDLASPDQLRFWLCVLADLQAWLLEVVFPSHMKTHRHGGDLTLLLASLLTMQGFVTAISSSVRTLGSPNLSFGFRPLAPVGFPFAFRSRGGSPSSSLLTTLRGNSWGRR